LRYFFKLTPHFSTFLTFYINECNGGRARLELQSLQCRRESWTPSLCW